MADLMLTPAQVIPFLTHDDPLVRRYALSYFRDCPDPAPLTADDLWAVFDRLGGEGDGEMGDPMLSVATLLASVPQTERSVRRLLDTLAAGPSKSYAYHYQEAARDVDLPLLAEHRDLLLRSTVLLPDVVDHLRRRLALAEEPAEVLWDRLMALGRASAGKTSSEVDRREVDRLVEAAGQHVHTLAAAAMATMADAEAAEDWREIFAVRVLGQGRYAPATAALVEKLDIDADILREEAVRALARINTVEVVERLAAFIPGRRWDVRLYADDPLGNIKRPESEAALLRLLPLETADDIRLGLLYELCDLGSLAGLDVARPLIEADPENGEVVGLCEALLATAVMVGQELPEASRWRMRVDAAEAKRAERMVALRDGGLAALADLMRERAREMGLNLDDEDEPSAQPPAWTVATGLTPMRAAPKVGRNDPCPCGSGKKHKKCCGAPK
jgi:hypothetical protein